MDEGGSHMTERMLQLTLEIIYLLTGENYSVVKTASLESFFCEIFPSVAHGWIRRRSPVSTPPPCSSPTPERSNKRRILEVRTRLVELLAAQDMAAALPVEKWDCGEGSWDLYTEAMMEAEPADLPTAEGTEENPARVKEELVSLTEENPLPLPDSPEPAHQYSTPHIKEEHLPCEDARPLVTLAQCPHNSSGHSPKEARLPGPRPDSPTLSDSRDVCNEDIRPLRFGASLFTEENHLDVSLYSGEKRFQPSDGSFEDEQRPPRYHTTLHQADNHLPRFDSPLHCEMSRPEISSASEQSLPTAEEPFSLQEEHSLQPDMSVYGQYGAAPEKASAGVERVGRFFHRVPNAHPKPHAVGKPRCCPICRKRFDGQLELEEHRAAYMGRKPYCCCVCRRAFPNKASLSIHHQRHLEVSPGDGKGCRNEGQGACPGPKPYSCLECGKCFTSYSNLSNHQKLHTGLKPYACSECGKCFVRRFNLVRHMTVHRKQTVSCNERMFPSLEL